MTQTKNTINKALVAISGRKSLAYIPIVVPNITTGTKIKPMLKSISGLSLVGCL